MLAFVLLRPGSQLLNLRREEAAVFSRRVSREEKTDVKAHRLRRLALLLAGKKNFFLLILGLYPQVQPKSKTSRKLQNREVRAEKLDIQAENEMMPRCLLLMLKGGAFSSRATAGPAGKAEVHFNLD